MSTRRATRCLLHDGPLPGARFNAVRVYSGQRTDDILGAPYLKDLDDLQVQLNHLITLRMEFLVRFARPPLVARADSLAEDTVVTADDAVLEFAGDVRPEFLYPPIQAIALFDSAIGETLDQFFRIAGWQAASRGESKSGDPAAKVVALQRTDDSLFGPINRDMQGAICELLQAAHALAKQYMTAPMLIDLVGEEWGHIADPWIPREEMSDRPPIYRLTNAFGATPEAHAEQLMNLVVMRGSDGMPLLSTQQFWSLWPDHSLRPPEMDASQVRMARAQAINAWIEGAVADAREQLGPTADQFAQQLWQQLGSEWELERSDNPAQHIEVLDQIVQNAWADPLARQLARWRQSLYYNWLASMQQQQAAAAQPPGGMSAPSGQPRRPSGQQRIAQANGEPMNPAELGSTVRALTEQAAEG